MAANKEEAKQQAESKVIKSILVDVVVLEKWGNHKKGAKLKMHPTTAAACVTHMKVRIVK